MVSFTQPGEGSDALWAAFAKDLDRASVTKFFATGMGPAEVTSVQRKMVAEVLKRRRLPAVAVTDDRLLRAMVTALSWLGVDIKAFSWAEMPEAAEFLKIPPVFATEVINTVEMLRQGKVKPK
jgi:hypothetical protein